jgi:hypothetical protein
MAFIILSQETATKLYTLYKSLSIAENLQRLYLYFLHHHKSLTKPKYSRIFHTLSIKETTILEKHGNIGIRGFNVTRAVANICTSTNCNNTPPLNEMLRIRMKP